MRQVAAVCPFIVRGELGTGVYRRGAPGDAGDLNVLRYL